MEQRMHRTIQADEVSVNSQSGNKDQVRESKTLHNYS